MHVLKFPVTTLSSSGKRDYAISHVIPEPYYAQGDRGLRNCEEFLIKQQRQEHCCSFFTCMPPSACHSCLICRTKQKMSVSVPLQSRPMPFWFSTDSRIHLCTKTFCLHPILPVLEEPLCIGFFNTFTLTQAFSKNNEM